MDEIIPEQYETSVEIFVRLLEKYLVPKDKIEKMVNDLRANGYRRLRKLVVDPEGIDSGFGIKDGLPGIDIQVLKVGRGSGFEGKMKSSTKSENSLMASTHDEKYSFFRLCG